MERLLTLQLKRIALMLPRLRAAYMEIIKLEDVAHTSQEQETETTINMLVAIRELELMQHDINQIRRRLIQR